MLLWRRGLNDELNCNVCGLYCKLVSSPRLAVHSLGLTGCFFITCQPDSTMLQLSYDCYTALEERQLREDALPC